MRRFFALLLVANLISIDSSFASEDNWQAVVDENARVMPDSMRSYLYNIAIESRGRHPAGNVEFNAMSEQEKTDTLLNSIIREMIGVSTDEAHLQRTIARVFSFDIREDIIEFFETPICAFLLKQMKDKITTDVADLTLEDQDILDAVDEMCALVPGFTPESLAKSTHISITKARSMERLNGWSFSRKYVAALPLDDRYRLIFEAYKRLLPSAIEFTRASYGVFLRTIDPWTDLYGGEVSRIAHIFDDFRRVQEEVLGGLALQLNDPLFWREALVYIRRFA